jgi:hypothetical protein
MRHLVYVLRFTGRAVPAAGAPDVLKATTTAPGCAATTRVGPAGVRGALEPLEPLGLDAGGAAAFESEVVLTGDAAFQERGSITFGDGGHRLRFSTVGQGHLGPRVEPGLRHGAVTWQVDGGEGQFAGARGLITSNFLITDAGDVTDHHLGLLFVA